MRKFWIALGGNLGDRENYFSQALRSLELLEGVRLLRGSAIYETPPVGPAGQDDYWNAVVEGETVRAPLDLLACCQAIENSLGRTRDVRWGARTIDLDLLMMAGVQMSDPALELPHPRIAERAFVLRPLADLIPDGSLEAGTVRECLEGVSEEGIQKVRESVLECR